VTSVMSDTFTKQSLKEKHRQTIQTILDNGGDATDIVNYLMSRISTVISYERRKYEHRLMMSQSLEQRQ
jgi:hypothetical protein